MDFLVMGSDGIFDKLKNHHIGTIVWNVIKEFQDDPSVTMHQICSKAGDEILRHSAKEKTYDNISIVVIGFKKMHEYLEKIRSNTISEPIESAKLTPSTYKHRWEEQKSQT